jgi:dTDP-4-amino-4,6-dideoxygalactose transaminase
MVGNTVQTGPATEKFYRKFGQWLGAPHVMGTASGRSAFQLALESLDLQPGAEIIFPVFTFPVIPMVAKMLGYQPVFCDVDPLTYNSGPEHVAPKITARTGAVLATHLFGQPCPILQLADLAREEGIRLLEDCAHACGVRIDGRQVGTFGDIGIFSFAEGKNMPCFGGGAIATADDAIARRAAELLSRAPVSEKKAAIQKAFSIWLKWLLTRPFVFGITAYPALRLKLWLKQPLMDSTVGDELLEKFENSHPHIDRMCNLQAAIGLRQLDHIDAFNEGARENARILTQNIGQVPDIRVPDAAAGGHIYVYYPLTVEPAKRDDLRHYLLKKGFDAKISDMSDCTALKPFAETRAAAGKPTGTREASILEICVYPVIARHQMRRLAGAIRSWAGLPPRA